MTTSRRWDLLPWADAAPERLTCHWACCQKPMLPHWRVCREHFDLSITLGLTVWPTGQA